MSGVTGTENPPDSLESGGTALKLHTDTPHLVNIGGDRLSTSVTLHPIPPGRVTLGCGSGVDIAVQGTGVLPLHCHIENSEGVVTIYPLSENLSIDGVKIFGPTRLSQGVMLTIGRSNYMRFNHPQEAKIMKSVLPNPRISNAPINFEPAEGFQSKFNRKPPTVPRKSPQHSLDESGVEEPPPSSIMTKVSKFEYLAQQNFKKSISPKVFASNSVTVNTPAKDVLGKSPPDIQNFTKSLPQNALNYSELNHNDKHQAKVADRAMFGGKRSPQYVNVTLNETKTINNRVIIYENGASKNQNVNLDHNDLNNKTSSCNKNINVTNRVMTPSPGYNRNPGPYYRSVTPSPVSSTNKTTALHRRSGSLGELTGSSETLENLAQRNNNAEMRRNQAHQERLREQELEKVEQARLEEILNMCVEYEKQAQHEKSNKVTPNRIKTNGSLPRDKRQYGHLSPTYGTPPPSPMDVEVSPSQSQSQHHSYENVNIISQKYHEKASASYENIDLKSSRDDKPKCGSPYENVYLHQSSTPTPISHSPRTRIKTFVTSTKEQHVIKDAAEIIENKFAILEAEQILLQNRAKTGENPKRVSPSKFIFPLENSERADKVEILNSSKSVRLEDKIRSDRLRKDKKELITMISTIKREMAELEIHEEELHREIELEHALISGELQCKLLELSKLESKKEKLGKYSQRIEQNMHHSQMKQDQDQLECKKKLEDAQKHFNEVEDHLSATAKPSDEYERVFDEYLKAQESLDNEKKTFEDLEFHHLEEEANWLASKEEVQREIIDLSKRIESVQEQIQDLEQQKYKISKSNNSELNAVKNKRSDCFVKLEKTTVRLKRLEHELSMFPNQESEHEGFSSDSDVSDKSKDLERRLSNMSLNVVYDMSTSYIVSNSKRPLDNVMYNMSQSFNEKLLDEKSILERGIGQKYPSQDDIDRISKVTSDAPINMGEDHGSIGRKTIESLKDIERKRHLHLAQQAPQVIELERKRVLALKQRVQEEVRSQWAQTKQDSLDLNASGESEISAKSDTAPVDHITKTERPAAPSSPVQNEAVRSSSEGPESPRPMSEISEMSVETGGTLNGRKRMKSPSDKQRPLTRYLPIRGSDLDLRQHIESAGHQVVLCPHVIINSTSCRGFLHKKGSKLNGWSRRWFVFDRLKHTFTYYNDKTEKKPKGGAYFQAIEEVYLDHLNSVKSPNPQLTFIVKTRERFYYLMAPSPEAMRIWVDVIFTGAEGYQEFEYGT